MQMWSDYGNVNFRANCEKKIKSTSNNRLVGREWVIARLFDIQAN